MLRSLLSALAAVLVLVGAPLAHAQPTLPLNGGQDLVRGQRYASPSGGHYLVFQADGNLVVYTAADGYVWGLNETPADIARAGRVAMQADGNLAVYAVDGTYLWSALTADPDPSARLTVSSSGGLRLVSAGRGVLWSSDGDRTVEAPEAEAPSSNGGCTPDPGWDACRVLDSPLIEIHSTDNVSTAAVSVVADIYADMTSRLRPDYPASRFDGFKIYVTNGESQRELDALPSIAEFAPDPTGTNSKDWLRGGTGGDLLWISEQMICKTGVASRNRESARDNTVRTFDQVVHEFSHALSNMYGLSARYSRFYTTQEDADFPVYERFPWTVQNWFSSPAGTLRADESALLSDLFSSRTSYSCDAYQP